MNVLLRLVFNELDSYKIAYCVLRDYDRLATMGVDDGEIDILVAPDQFDQFASLMGELEFTRFSRWGEYPHTHFAIVLRENSRRFEIDVVTQLAFGNPVRHLHTTLADNCLSHRRLVDGVYIPRPEDELMVLLLHCLLDKRQIKPHRAERIKALRGQVVDEAYLSRLCAQYWSSETSWSQIDGLIAASNWQELLAQRKAVVLHIARQDALGTWTRALGKRTLRKLDHFARIVRSNRALQ